jgi:FMN-dependent NADH-azoreductase
MTYNILHIDSSPLGDNSVSRKFTAKVVDGLKAKHPDAKVTVRDFGKDPLPHLTGPMIGAYFTPADKHTDMQAEAIKPSEQAVAELIAADAIVIGVPMWNFGIPSALKAWIDHVVRSGKTFKYGPNGPEGLLAPGKKVIVVLSSGGIYSTGPLASIEHQASYMKSALAFLGLTDVTFVRAEGVAMGPDAVKAAMQTAETQVNEALKMIA